MTNSQTSKHDSLQDDTMNKFLIHYGEIGLKGRNRCDFEKALQTDLMLKLSDLSENTEQDIHFETHNKYFFLKVSPKISSQIIIKRLKRVFGIKWFAHVKQLPHDNTAAALADITSEIVKLAKPQSTKAKTFKIECKRADKRFPKTSQQIERLIGREVIQETKYQKVDLTNPDCTYFVEITHSQILVFDKKISGPGGLPVNASGRVLLLLSGGIDSPVAAYLMAKRGCSIDFLHFYVNKPGKDDKIMRLVQQTAKYTGEGRLYLLPYLPFNMKILDIQTLYELVLFRRFIFRVGEQLIQNYLLQALITGDNLGQVASQTLENLNAADDALEETTCLRPLISYDKFEIIQIAKQIKTFQLSNEKHKDCCSIIDKHAKTRVTLDRIHQQELKITNYQQLIEETINELEIVDINPY